MFNDIQDGVVMEQDCNVLESHKRRVKLLDGWWSKATMHLEERRRKNCLMGLEEKREDENFTIQYKTQLPHKFLLYR